MAASTGVADVQAFHEPGSLPQLIERLTGQDAAPHLANYLLITYKDYSTAEELLACLRKCFDDNSDAQQRNVRLRIVNILKLWVTNHFNDLSTDEASVAGVKDLLAHIGKSAGMEKAAEAVMVAIGRRSDEKARRGTVLPPASEEPKSPIPSPRSPRDGTNTLNQNARRTVSLKDSKEVKKKKKDYLLSLEPEHVAQQISLWDQEIFRGLVASEFLGSAWTKEDKKLRAPHVCTSIQHFNYLNRWVATEVLTQVDRSARTKMAKHFVQVADHLFKVNEYNAAMAIAAGLGDITVTRLRDHIEYSSATQKSLETIRKLLIPPFREIRTLARKQHGPCIPYIGSYLGDLAMMDEGNPRMINNAINFRKYALMASVIDELLRFQLIPYTFEPDTELQEYFRTSGALSDEKLTECSNSIVPDANKSPSRRSFISQDPIIIPKSASGAPALATPGALTGSAILPAGTGSEILSPRRAASERGTISTATAAAVVQALMPTPNPSGTSTLTVSSPRPAIGTQVSPGRPGPALTTSLPLTSSDNLANEVRALKAELNRQRDELGKASQEAERARMEISSLQESLAQRDQKFAEVLAMAQAAVLKNKEYEDRFAILEADSRVLHATVTRLQRLLPEQKIDESLNAEELALQKEEEELKALEEEHRRTYGTLRGKRV